MKIMHGIVSLLSFDISKLLNPFGSRKVYRIYVDRLYIDTGRFVKAKGILEKDMFLDVSQKEFKESIIDRVIDVNFKNKQRFCLAYKDKIDKFRSRADDMSLYHIILFDKFENSILGFRMEP